LSTGYEDLIPFSEVEYCPVYDLLYQRIDTDYNHPDYGHVVRERFEGLKQGVMFTQISSS